MIIDSAALAEKLRSPDQNDPLVIEPSPDLKELVRRKSSSVDVHLGRWFLLPRVARLPNIDTDDLAEDRGALRAAMRKMFIPFQSEFHLHPGSFVLGATLEWVRVPATMAGQIVGKSSWGRRGLVVETASMIHPGFTGCLTLELTNLGELPVVLRPGMPVAQVTLFQLSGGISGAAGRFGGYRRPALGTVERDHLSTFLLPKPRETKAKATT